MNISFTIRRIHVLIAAGIVLAAALVFGVAYIVSAGNKVERNPEYERAYLGRVSKLPLSDEELLEHGYRVCDDLASGTDYGQVRIPPVGEAMHLPGATAYKDGLAIMAAATDDLCPGYVD